MKKAIVPFLLFMTCFSYSSQAACNWKSRIVKFIVEDSCTSYPTLYGSIQLKSYTSISYDWKVLNGGESKWWYNNTSFLYYPGSNSTYTVCLKLTDNANNCDTTICKTISFNCLPNCNWKGQNIYMRSDDSCKSDWYVYKNGIAGMLMTNNNYHSTYAYEWKMNGTLVHDTGSQVYYPLDSNGTYELCVKVSDTVNNCDTTICKTFNITCISNCNWKNRKPLVSLLDSCKQSSKTYKIMGGISFNGSYSGKYPCEWIIDGVSIPGTSSVIQYSISHNGTYKLCVKVKDTINKCDTTFCTYVVVDCIACAPWKNKIASFYLNDTCDQYPNKVNNRIDGILGGVNMTSQSSYPYVYKWTVNGTAMYPASYMRGSIFYKAPNGTYTVCMNVRDTLNNCDTTICKTVTVKCSPCGKWKGKISRFYLSDSCSSGFGGVHGLLTFPNASDYTYYKYRWTVNSAAVPGNYSLHRSLANGTYTICVNIRDTVKNCDTTICRTVVVYCGPCIWKNRITSFGMKDTCQPFYSYVLGNVQLNNNSHVRYEWTVIDTNGGSYQQPFTGSTYYFYPAANGYYTICLRLRDTRLNCDTSICRTVFFNCLPPCQWDKHTMYLNSWDSCMIYSSTRNSIGGMVTTNGNHNSRLKYKWTMNDSISLAPDSNGIATYIIPENGTYTLCVKVIDSINNCDTTLCRTYNITCVPNCNWKQKQPHMISYDSCDTTTNSNEILAGISFTNNNNTTNYYHYQWSVNGKKTGSNDVMLKHRVTSNGTYLVCVKIQDTVKNCDTTICQLVVVDCMNCDIWKTKIAYFYVNDTCDQYPNKVNNRHDGVVGWLNFTNPASYIYYQYEWTVNSSPVAGNGFRIDERFTSNASYDICVKIIDTSNQCDTTLCKTINVNCATLGIEEHRNTHQDLHIYPNPAGDYAGFDWDGQAAGYELMNLLGEVVSSGDVNSGHTRIAIKDLPNGVYLIRIQNNERLLSARLIIQH